MCMHCNLICTKMIQNPDNKFSHPFSASVAAFATTFKTNASLKEKATESRSTPIVLPLPLPGANFELVINQIKISLNEIFA
jgi:hypothetical protein